MHVQRSKCICKPTYINRNHPFGWQHNSDKILFRFQSFGEPVLDEIEYDQMHKIHQPLWIELIVRFITSFFCFEFCLGVPILELYIWSETDSYAYIICIVIRVSQSRTVTSKKLTNQRLTHFWSLRKIVMDQSSWVMSNSQVPKPMEK